MTRRGFTVLLVAALCACGDTLAATQVMVVVDAEAGVRARAKDVRIRVRGGSGAASAWEDRYDAIFTEGTAEITWPLEVAIVPKSDDAERVYEVTATAIDATGADVSQVRAISGYVKHEARALLMLFEDECLAKWMECSADETCQAGDCVDAHVPLNLLPLYESGDDRGLGFAPFGDVDASASGADASASVDGSTVGRADAGVGGSNAGTGGTPASEDGGMAGAGGSGGSDGGAPGPDAGIDSGDPAKCPASLTCRDFFGNNVCTDATNLPPACTVGGTECDAYGIECSTAAGITGCWRSCMR